MSRQTQVYIHSSTHTSSIIIIHNTFVCIFSTLWRRLSLVCEKMNNNNVLYTEEKLYSKLLYPVFQFYAHFIFSLLSYVWLCQNGMTKQLRTAAEHCREPHSLHIWQKKTIKNEKKKIISTSLYRKKF